MTKEIKEEFFNNIKDVISTSKAARDLLFKNGKVQSHTEDDIQVVRQVVQANKNIVSATIVGITLSKNDEE